MRRRSLLAIALPAALLAGCGGGSDDNDDRTATGEVLEASVSDAMIPLEQLESQPPLMRERASEEAEAGGILDPASEAESDEGPGENPLL